MLCVWTIGFHLALTVNIAISKWALLESCLMVVEALLKVQVSGSSQTAVTVPCRFLTDSCRMSQVLAGFCLCMWSCKWTCYKKMLEQLYFILCLVNCSWGPSMTTVTECLRCHTQVTVHID